MAPVAVNGASHTNGTLTNGEHPSTNVASSKPQSSYASKFNLPAHFIGGNHLDAAPPSSVKDFVANNDGHSVITSVSFHPATPLGAPLDD